MQAILPPPPPIAFQAKPVFVGALLPRFTNKSTSFPAQQVSPVRDTTTATMAQPQIAKGERRLDGLSPLEAAPFDVILGIASLLDYGSVLQLSLANSRLRQSLHPDALCPLPAKFAFFQQVEKYQQHMYRLACFRCWRLLPRQAFTDSHRCGRRGKNSLSLSKQRERCCFDCGVKDLVFPDMRGFVFNSQRMYLCHQCGEWCVSRP